jgi:solute carrier family 25 (mitochondrial 2-oxodicarboxylate transporter), member 21
MWWLQPVDVTMIHQQKLGMSPLGAISHLARTFGVTSLWRGLAPTAIREAIYTAGYLALTPVFTAKLMQRPGWEESYFPSSVLGAMGAGVIANVASHPIDTAKTVLQADVEGRQYRSTLQSMGQIYRTNGLMGFYLGDIARTARTCGVSPPPGVRTPPLSCLHAVAAD